MTAKNVAEIALRGPLDSLRLGLSQVEGSLAASHRRLGRPICLLSLVNAAAKFGGGKAVVARIEIHLDGKVVPGIRLPLPVRSDDTDIESVLIFFQNIVQLRLRVILENLVDILDALKNDLPLALRMIKNRKLKLLPSTGAIRFSKRESEKKDVIGYYPGCSLHGTSREYNASTVAVFKKLGLKLEEPKNWSCCGSTPAHSTDHYASILHPVKNVVAMQQKGFRRITTPCPSCFLRLRSGVNESANEDIKEKLLRDVNELPLPEVKIDHLLTTVVEEVGFQGVAQKVSRPLKGMKVACYYGCIITRPPKITKVPDYEYPMQMDNLMKSLGADPLPWSYKTRCCGASLAVSQLPIALHLTRKILQNAKDVGADAVVVACPLCQVNLDARQKQLTEEGNGAFHLPIIYFTQLMGLAFGLDPGELELDKHFIDSGAIIKNLQKVQQTG